MPSRIDPGTANVAAITFASPLLKPSMYWRTAAIGSFVLISATPFFGSSLRILSGHLGNRSIRQYRTETNAERNTVEITTFHVMSLLRLAAVVLLIS